MYIYESGKENMSNVSKPGLDYFPKDVNYYDDFKIIDLIAEYGPAGQIVYDFILTQIYKEGYYIEMPVEKVALLAVRAVGSRWVTKEFAINVITYCGDIGLFRVDLLSKGVITSAGVQRRYEEIKKRLRRKFNKEKYWILDEDGEECAKCTDDTDAQNSQKAQKCVKKQKEDEYPLLSAPINEQKCTNKQDKCAEMQDNCTFIDTKRKGKERNKIKRKGRETSEPAAIVFQTFEECGFKISPHITERLIEMIDDYSADWVIEAIKRSADRGKKTISYIEGILRNWEQAGAIDGYRGQNGKYSSSDNKAHKSEEDEFLESLVY